MATAVTLCPEIWIKLKETSSALGRIFGVLYIQSLETLQLLDKDISFLEGDSFWHSWPHSSHNSHCTTTGAALHFKGIRGPAFVWSLTADHDHTFKLQFKPLCSAAVVFYSNMSSLCHQHCDRARSLLSWYSTMLGSVSDNDAHNLQVSMQWSQIMHYHSNNCFTMWVWSGC